MWRASVRCVVMCAALAATGCRRTPPQPGDPLVERGGPVIQAHVTPALETALGITAEPLPEGLIPGHRTTPDLFGFGLLDGVPEKLIMAHADPDDRDHDGVSGRPNRTADGSI